MVLSPVELVVDLMQLEIGVIFLWPLRMDCVGVVFGKMTGQYDPSRKGKYHRNQKQKAKPLHFCLRPFKSLDEQES